MRFPAFVLFLLLFGILTGNPLSAQHKGWKKEVRKFQKELNHHYRDEETSPLKEADRATFRHHAFFKADLRYRVVARVERTPDAPEFEMPTVSGVSKTYRQYAILSFELEGEIHRIPVYQSIKLMQDEQYKDYLFLPFKDLSSGEESYGGGRYLDLRLPEGDELVVDFNQAYNPYCAYSDGWSCPIPPDANFINARILAGVRAWDAGH